MCGRFTQVYTWRELVALYGLTQPADERLKWRAAFAPFMTGQNLTPNIPETDGAK